MTNFSDNNTSEDYDFKNFTHNSEIIVRNIHKGASKDSLERFFEKYGRIYSISKKSDKNNSSLQFAYIQFEKPSVAQRAIKNANGKLFMGKNLLVSSKNPHKDNVNDNETVYVCNFDQSYEEKDIRNIFKDCGKIMKVSSFAKSEKSMIYTD